MHPHRTLSVNPASASTKATSGSTLAGMSQLMARCRRGDWVVAAALALGLTTPMAQAQTGKASAKLQPNSTVANCSWDHPGKNPYMGELPAAVDRFGDIAPDVRARLKQRIASQQYDDMVVIKRDAIASSANEGKFSYASNIRDMHFGDQGRVCRSVTRSKWKPTMTERGLVYCESGQCILVPTVCRNVSRVNRQVNEVAAKPEQAPTAALATPAAPVVAAAKPQGVAPSEFAAPAAVAAAPAFADVAQGPVFAFPTGPSGTSSTSVVTPTDTGSGGTTGGTTGGTGGSTIGGIPSTGGGATSGTTVDPVVVPGTVPTPGGTTTTPGGGTTGVIPGETIVSPIPEPSTWALMLGGLLALIVVQRRTARQQQQQAKRVRIDQDDPRCRDPQA